ncbi:MAG: hydroxymethylbilane synthase [Bacteroidota bacterium]|nr:hydroxymethylbilane synthase [Bacteroidota bacterium]
MSRKIRIGTRDSKLALWQANYIQMKLKINGVESELVLIKSDGEQNLTTPLYEMGVQGIFTRALDISLLQNKIDIAVHSLKDVPTQIADNLTLAAVPQRGNFKDVLVYKEKIPQDSLNYVVATSSLRRSAQWLHRYKIHQTTILRGNINTRLAKLHENRTWDAALFAAAGIERINLDVPNMIELDWMIPAPAQGALGIISRIDDFEINQICKLLEHPQTRITCGFERKFLRKLMGGCSMPIGGLAQVINNQLYFKGCVLTIDGKKMSYVEVCGSENNIEVLLEEAVGNLIEDGGGEIIKTFKN